MCYELREDFLNLFKQLQEESEGEDSCNECSVDLSDEIDVEVASGHELTSSQVNIIQDNHA
jgi:predicted adenine nucleotide alpha hydrolase (AANH) superfamily ATPase